MKSISTLALTLGLAFTATLAGAPAEAQRVPKVDFGSGR